jgi:hypothetical protein
LFRSTERRVTASRRIKARSASISSAHDEATIEEVVDAAAEAFVLD